MNGGTPTGIVMEKPIEIGCCSFQLPKTHWLFAELNYLVLQWEEDAMRRTAVWDLQKGGCDHQSWEEAQLDPIGIWVGLFFSSKSDIYNTIFEFKIWVSVALEG